jgi:glycine/D-amino acid oxidase-like deaminating enzyme
MEDFDSLVVGGGLLGCMAAARLGELGHRTLLVEPDADLPRPDFLPSPGRLHLSYHPSPEAGRRSLANLRRFAAEFRDCVSTSHATLLAVGRAAPKVTAAQLHAFHQQFGAPITVAPEVVRRLFDPVHVETVFLAEEAVIDPARLRERLQDRLAAGRVELLADTSALEVKPLASGLLRVTLSGGAVRARRVFNCGGPRLNALQHRSGLPPLPVRHELAEAVVVEAPPPLHQAGLTILSGPFFSLTPASATPHHTLSHTRFSPHAGWADLGPAGPTPEEVLARVAKQTGFERMRREASRYMPCLGNLRYQGSGWEVKTSPLDGAAFAFHAHAGCRNLHAVVGERVDCLYDVLDRLERVAGERSVAAA